MARRGGQDSRPRLSAPKHDDLTLKVLRLSRPFIPERRCPQLVVGIRGESRGGLDVLPLDDTMGIQRSFGTIYTGEVFRCILSLFNNADAELRNIVIKAELQTAGSKRERVVILDTTEAPVGKLVSGEMKDFVASKRIKETGLHNLVCSVRYVNTDGDVSSFVKAFEFQGHDPLKIKRRIFQLKQDLFFEAQINNVTQSTLFLQKVELRPTEYYRCWDLGVEAREDLYLSPGGSSQFLYRLRPTEQLTASVPKEVEQLFGSMEITWNSSVGGKGNRVHHLRKKVSGSTGEVAVELLGFPPALVLERPTSIICQVTNHTSRTVEPVLQIARGGVVAISSVSNRAMDPLPAGAVLRVPLQVVPFSAGVHSVGGVKILDNASGVVYEPDCTYSIIVEFADDDLILPS